MSEQAKPLNPKIVWALLAFSFVVACWLGHAASAQLQQLHPNEVPRGDLGTVFGSFKFYYTASFKPYELPDTYAPVSKEFCSRAQQKGSSVWSATSGLSLDNEHVSMKTDAFRLRTKYQECLVGGATLSIHADVRAAVDTPVGIGSVTVTFRDLDFGDPRFFERQPTRNAARYIKPNQFCLNIDVRSASRSTLISERSVAITVILGLFLFVVLLIIYWRVDEMIQESRQKH